ncbi:MAG TPA: hypothetical protein VM661_16975 [Candidatus Sulfotelmatobacter sp.]|jgi:hypothetical protein|nr:hypothetical protein [Candidatus Sulfotelmatobacter sp.]
MSAGILPVHLRQLVIAPALSVIGLGGQAAEELLLGTALQESLGGVYLHQLGLGPAIGIFQMEPRTHDDLWSSFLPHHVDLSVKTSSLLVSGMGRLNQMAGNMLYAAAMARLLYYRCPETLPAAGDIPAQAAFYKRWYNTAGGAATIEGYLSRWKTACS